MSDEGGRALVIRWHQSVSDVIISSCLNERDRHLVVMVILYLVWPRVKLLNTFLFSVNHMKNILIFE